MQGTREQLVLLAIVVSDPLGLQEPFPDYSGALSH